MKNKQNILLAGVAALALLAGTGLASAQTGKKDNGAATQLNNKGGTSGASNHAITPGAGATGAAGASASTSLNTQSRASNNDRNAKGPGAGMAQKGTPQQGQSAQNMKPGTGGRMNRMNRTAQGEHRRGRTMAEQRPLHGRNAATAQKNERGNPNTAQQLESNKRLQGNTSIPMQGGSAGRQGANLGNVQLSDQQRSTIRSTVIDARGAPRVGHVDFNVQVGTVVPRRGIRIVRVPETLVRIDPRWRGYEYFVFEDEVVIVNPRDMRIVAVVAA